MARLDEVSIEKPLILQGKTLDIIGRQKKSGYAPRGPTHIIVYHETGTYPKVQKGPQQIPCTTITGAPRHAAPSAAIGEKGSKNEASGILVGESPASD